MSVLCVYTNLETVSKALVFASAAVAWVIVLNIMKHNITPNNAPVINDIFIFICSFLTSIRLLIAS